MNNTPATGLSVRVKENTRRFRPYNQDSGFICDPSDGAQVNKFLQNSGRKSVKTKSLQFVQMATIFAVSISAFAINTYAQNPSGSSRTTTEVKPTVYVPANAPPAPVAKEKEMTCGGSRNRSSTSFPRATTCLSVEGTSKVYGLGRNCP